MTEKNTTQTNCTTADTTANNTCCVDTYRIYDSCIGQECLRGLRVCFTDQGQRILNTANAVRIQDLKVIWVQILSEEVPFRTGYYSINLRYYFAVTVEVCLGLGVSSQIRGIACYDKNVLLYGGEGSVSIFTSDSHQNYCSAPPSFGSTGCTTNAPRIVAEVAAPVGLEINLLDETPEDNCESCNIPAELAAQFEGSFNFSNPAIEKTVYVTLGIFTLVRVERCAQLMLNTCTNCFPDKTCEGDTTFSDACSLFNSMSFPYEVFSPAPAGETLDLTTEKYADDPGVDPAQYR